VGAWRVNLQDVFADEAERSDFLEIVDSLAHRLRHSLNGVVDDMHDAIAGQAENQRTRQFADGYTVKIFMGRP
jgi:phage tail protein X